MKIGIIQKSKFNISNYSDVIKLNDFTEVNHRTVVYKKLVAFEEYINGYPFDYVFDTIEELDAFIVSVPQTITKFQASKQLREMGKYQDLMTILDLDPTGDAKIDWTDAQNLNRNHELVLGLAQALGMDSNGVDDFFVEANKY